MSVDRENQVDNAAYQPAYHPDQGKVAQSPSLTSPCLLSHEPDPAPTTSVCGRGRVQRTGEEVTTTAKGMVGAERVDQQGLRGRNNYQLQERDRRVLELCYEQQFLTLDQVSRFFFGGYIGNASRRMSSLRSLGLLRTQSVLTLGGKVEILRVTARGRTEARKGSKYLIPQVRQVGFSTLSHDAMVIDTRVRLQSLWEATWIPERVLKHEKLAQVPDGVLVFQSGKKVAVEVENSLKGKARYQRIWKAYQDGPSLALVLYVVASERLLSRIKTYMADAPSGLAFGAVLWSDLKSGVPSLWTPKGELPLFSRKVIG